MAVKKGEKLPYPKSVFFIVSNEFCERFTFYGMRTILSLYLKNQLGFTDTLSTVIYHVFIMICYFFPLLGAIVADSWLGKFKTILYLSIVYAVGNVVVSVSSAPFEMPKVALTMIGLVLIALGTGGIKPCVSAFGGDQFVMPQQEDQLKKFFSLFYFAINSGSFVSTFLTPILRETPCFGEETCYPLAFGVPATLMVIAIVIYIGGKPFYKIKEPEGNVVVKVAKCMWHAARSKGQGVYEHWLDKAQDKYEKGFIDDIKATLRVLILYIPLPIFWALFDQQGSRWTFQAARMNGEVGSFKIQPDQMQVVNPVLILAFIPLFETGLYPLLAKCNLLKRPLQKLTVGGILAAAAFGVSALVEIQLEPTYPVLPTTGEGQLRLYNGLGSNVSAKIAELNAKIEITPLNMWADLHIPVQKERKMSLEIAGSTRDISVFEKNATSYILLPGDVIIQVKGDIADKSNNGNPRFMVIYSSEGSFNLKTVELVDTSNDVVNYKAELRGDHPYKQYAKVPLSADKYRLTVDGKTVLTNIELKQGGVYVAMIREQSGELKANLLTTTQPNSVHILWLIPQYVIITAGEVMFSITGLEFSFTQAPSTMKSLLQAAWLLTVAIGNLVVVIVAEAKLFERQTYEFLLFAGLMLLDMMIFALIAMRYTYVEDLVEQTEEDAEENDKTDKNKG